MLQQHAALGVEGEQPRGPKRPQYFSPVGATTQASPGSRGPCGRRGSPGAGGSIVIGSSLAHTRPTVPVQLTRRHEITARRRTVRAENRNMTAAPRPREVGTASSCHNRRMEYEFDDDPDRIDRDAVWQWLSTEAYWGRWRTRADVEAQLDNAWRVVAAYHERRARWWASRGRSPTASDSPTWPTSSSSPRTAATASARAWSR